MAAVELHLLGPPRVLVDGRRVAFDTRKAVALLAVLAVAGREVDRGALAALLWPELDRTRARAALRRTLSVAAAVGPALVTSATGAALDLDAVRCDVREFRALAAGSDPAGWRRAAGLAEEGFLAGFSLRDSPAFEEWQLATAEAIRDELSRVLARLVAAEAGGPAAAVAWARRRTGIDPLSEPAHADLIRALAASGDRAGALSAYRALVRMLDTELGVPPLRETVALQEAIRGERRPSEGERPHAVPVARWGGSALVGREKQLAELDAVWQQGGGVVGLVGDPGSGRTALAAAEQARRPEAARLLATGHEAERSLAYAVATDLLRGLLAAGAAPGPLEPLVGRAPIRTPGDLQRLHEAFRSAIAERAARERLLLVVDDAHLLDLPSAALIAYVARRPPPGLVLLVTWQRGAGGAPLPAAVSAQGRVIEVPPLDLGAVAALIGPEGDAVSVLERTGGLPLLVRELAGIGSATSGGSIDARELVTARLEAATDLTRQIVGAAAVIGTVSDPELLRSACGRDEAETVDAIEDGLHRGLLVEHAGRGYDVPHDIVREAAIARLSLARLRLLHGRIADLLARRHAVDPVATPAGAVARHLASAGRDEDAADWFMVAAAESSALAAHAEALEQLALALALGHRPAAVHEAIGTTLVRLGRYAEALVALDRAAALVEGDRARQAAIEHAIAGVHDRLGDWSLAQAHLEAARDLQAGPAGARARVLADLALVRHRLGDAASAADAAALAAAEAAAAADGTALAQAANVLGVLAAGRGAHGEAVSHLSEAVATARRVGSRDLEIAALNNLSHAALSHGDVDEAMGAAREALVLAEQQGDRHRLAALHAHMADLLHAAGRDDEALEEFRTSAIAFAAVQGPELRPDIWTLTEW